MCVFKDDELIPMIPDLKPEFTVSLLGQVEDYNHELTNVPVMWKHTKGKGVKVVVLDTGMPKHKDITVTGARSFIPGYLEDQNGHGTGCGSLIAGVGSNDMGIVGIAPEVDDYYGAVLNASGAGSLKAIADGIRWAVDEVGADIINMSLGTPAVYGCDERLEEACKYAYDKGVTLVAAAGNDNGRVNWPAALPQVIAVAAVDRKLRKAEFSSYGPEVEFSAGGVEVMMAYKNNGYASMSGTSFSAPVISGICALIISEYKSRGVKLTPEDVRTHLKSISYDLGPEGRDDFTGWGIPVFTRDTESAMGKPGKPKVLSWFGKMLRALKWW